MDLKDIKAHPTLGPRYEELSITIQKLDREYDELNKKVRWNIDALDDGIPVIDKLTKIQTDRNNLVKEVQAMYKIVE